MRGLVRAFTASLVLAGSAHAQCGMAPPPGVLIEPGDRILFYGDSITVGIVGTSYHYAALVRHLLASAYCSFELLEVEAIGQRGSHYVRYARRIGHDLGDSEIPYDWVMFQDAGRALKLSYARNPDSPRSFPAAVQQTINEARSAVPGIGILLATTPPLDFSNATSSWVVRYERVNEFSDHNAALEEIAIEGSHTVIPWNTDACRAYAQSPDAAWTRDGVHPQPFGDLLFALSIVRAFGVPRADLVLDDLIQFHPSLNGPKVSDIADWVYAPNLDCD